MSAPAKPKARPARAKPGGRAGAPASSRRAAAGPSAGGRRGRGGGKKTATRRDDDGASRLQKLLAQAGVASRRAAEALIAQGRVRVDGKAVTTLGTRVDPKLVTVEVDGRVIAAQEPTYLVMNKPDEVVSSAEADKDPRGRPTVVSLLTGLRNRVVPLGRLDYHTRGVLLLTNDGALHAALLHPRRAVPKTYHVKFQGRLGEPELAQLHAGVQLEDGTRTRPSLEAEIVRGTTTNTWVQLTISQGLNRQIRRMGDAIGHSVLKLIRVAFAGITADGLREGQWRHLRPDEVAGLYTLAGLKAPERVDAAPAATPHGVPVMRGRKHDRAADDTPEPEPSEATSRAADAGRGGEGRSRGDHPSPHAAESVPTRTASGRDADRPDRGATRKTGGRDKRGTTPRAPAPPKRGPKSGPKGPTKAKPAPRPVKARKAASNAAHKAAGEPQGQSQAKPTKSANAAAAPAVKPPKPGKHGPSITRATDARRKVARASTRRGTSAPGASRLASRKR